MFSIITPTYNRAHLIERTIRSVLAQTFPDWEYFIIDDGSTDNTDEVVKKYLTDPRIKFLKKENTGAAHTRNIGVSHANRSFVTFLDSDDEALPNWLEVVAQHIQPDTGLVCTGAIRVVENGPITNDLPREINYYGEKVKVKFTCGSLFFQRNVYLQSGGYDLSMPTGLQSELGYSLLKQLKVAGLKIVSLDVCPVKVYLHAGPRLRGDYATLHSDCVRFIDKTFDYFSKWDRKALSNNYTVIAFYNYKMKRRGSSLYYLFKAIRYRPLRVSNYMRMVKYALL